MQCYVALAMLASVAPCYASPLQATFAPSAKRGLAYNQLSLCTPFGDSFGFMYNWGQVENETGTKFVPMMHSPTKSTAAEWLANVDKAVGRGSRAVMGFNECDHAQQCNLSPEAACASWKEYMNPVKARYPNITIVGPSVTNGPAPTMGLQWLCPDAAVDATNIHFYDTYDSNAVERFKSQVKEASTSYSKKVWVTEFGLNPGSATQDQAASFLKDSMAFLDSFNDVEAYAWFMVGTGENELNVGTGLSPLGKIYANVV